MYFNISLGKSKMFYIRQFDSLSQMGSLPYFWTPGIGQLWTLIPNYRLLTSEIRPGIELITEHFVLFQPHSPHSLRVMSS